MGYLKYLKNTWKKPRQNLGQTYRDLLTLWRSAETVTRIEKPTRIDRARALGYKAKQGIVMVRVRMIRGGKENPKVRKGRKGGNLTRKIVHSLNYQVRCERKAQKRYPNLEALNSYWVGQDETYYYYEIVMVDPFHPQIIADKDLSWIVSNKHTKRAERGLTSAGKRCRGLRNKGMGAEKVRPSVRKHGYRFNA